MAIKQHKLKRCLGGGRGSPPYADDGSREREDIAIDCGSWAEIATAGESYALNNFDLYIEEY